MCIFNTANTWLRYENKSNKTFWSVIKLCATLSKLICISYMRCVSTYLPNLWIKLVTKIRFGRSWSPSASADATETFFRFIKIFVQKILTSWNQAILYGLGFDLTTHSKYTPSPSLISFGLSVGPILSVTIGRSESR